MSKEQLEMAARKYCELANLDPENLVEIAFPVGNRSCTYKQWELSAMTLQKHYMASVAIDYALKHSPAQGKQDDQHTSTT